MSQNYNQQTPAQSRVIDPILSNVAKQYRNADFVLQDLFPVIPVAARGGRVITFGKESFRLYATARAPGASTKRIQVGYASDPIALQQDSLEGLVPTELRQEAAAVPNIDLAAQAINTVQDTMWLGIEQERAQIATTPANYGTNTTGLTGTDKWSDPTAKVTQQIGDGKEAIRKRVGRYPSIMTISSNQLTNLKSNEEIKEKFKYTSSESITQEMLARFFEVSKVLVPLTVYHDATDSDTDDFQDIWGDFASLAWVPQGGLGLHVPSFGYTYRLSGFPMVEQPYEDRNAKSWVYPVTHEERPYHTAADAGFLFTGVTA